MSKATLSMEQLRSVCPMAFRSADLKISDVELVMVEERGVRTNWVLRALSPAPKLETAERVYGILVDLQDTFVLAGKCKIPVSALG
jgi:hypothetical protein